MRILILTNEIEIGGPKTYLLGLADFLQKKSSSLIFFKNKNSQSYSIFKNKFSQTVAIDKKITALFSLHRNIKKIDPTICIADSYLIAFLFIVINYVFFNNKYRLIYQFHGSSYLEKKSRSDTSFFKLFIIKYIENFVFHHAQKIIVFSTYSQTILVTNFSVKIKKIQVIYPGLDKVYLQTLHTHTKQEARLELGINQKRKVILLNSRIEKRKGLYEFFYNLNQNKSLFTKKSLIIIATDIMHNFDQWEYLFTHLKSLFDKFDIIFIQSPQRKKMALLTTAADLVILPSRKLETFGLVTIEAFFSNTPVIAFNIGANKELIQNDFLIKKNDYAAFMKKINTIISNKKSKKIANKISLDLLTYVNYVKELKKISNE